MRLCCIVPSNAFSTSQEIGSCFDCVSANLNLHAATPTQSTSLQTINVCISLVHAFKAKLQHVSISGSCTVYSEDCTCGPWFQQYAYNSGLEVQGACYHTACDTALRVDRQESAKWTFKRKETKRKEKTTPLGVNLMRSQVLYRAAQKWICTKWKAATSDVHGLQIRQQ